MKNKKKLIVSLLSMFVIILQNGTDTFAFFVYIRPDNKSNFQLS